MVRTRSPGENVFGACLYAIMILILFITLFPFWNQLAVSLSGGSGAYKTGVVLLPTNVSLESYKLIFKYDMLWIGYSNTIFRVCLGVVFSVIFTALTAYPLAKRDLPYNKAISSLILFTMLFGGGLIPNYLLIKNLGLYNTIWALVLPGMVGAFNVFIMRNFFRSIPDSLEESARVDGAGYFHIFWRIVIPLSKPVLATIALWVAVHHWNAWFDSMIYLSDPKKQVFQVVLRKIIVENNMENINSMLYQTDNANRFSGRQLQSTIIMFSMIPMLVVYPFIQKYFVSGIMIGAVKG